MTKNNSISKKVVGTGVLDCTLSKNVVADDCIVGISKQGRLMPVAKNNHRKGLASTRKRLRQRPEKPKTVP